jgi:hypothetical protein
MKPIVSARRASARVGELVDREPFDEHPAVVDLVEPREAVQERRLARPRRAHDGEELSLRHTRSRPLRAQNVGRRQTSGTTLRTALRHADGIGHLTTSISLEARGRSSAL